MVVELFRFRGGPVDGRELPVAPDQDAWSIPTVNGVWVGDRTEPLPEDLSTVEYRTDVYVRVDDEYIHESILPADVELPKWARLGGPESGFEHRSRVEPAPDHAGGAIRLIAVDFYEGGSAVRWEWTTATPKGPLSNPLAMRDDLETTYELAGVHLADKGLGPSLTYFVPAIPAAASWLEVSGGGVVVRFELKPS